MGEYLSKEESEGLTKKSIIDFDKDVKIEFSQLRHCRERFTKGRWPKSGRYTCYSVCEGSDRTYP